MSPAFLNKVAIFNENDAHVVLVKCYNSKWDSALSNASVTPATQAEGGFGEIQVMQVEEENCIWSEGKMVPRGRGYFHVQSSVQ